MTEIEPEAKAVEGNLKCVLIDWFGRVEHDSSLLELDDCCKTKCESEAKEKSASVDKCESEAKEKSASVEDNVSSESEAKEKSASVEGNIC